MPSKINTEISTRKKNDFIEDKNKPEKHKKISDTEHKPFILKSFVMLTPEHKDAINGRKLGNLQHVIRKDDNQYSLNTEITNVYKAHLNNKRCKNVSKKLFVPSHNKPFDSIYNMLGPKGKDEEKLKSKEKGKGKTVIIRMPITNLSHINNVDTSKPTASIHISPSNPFHTSQTPHLTTQHHPLNRDPLHISGQNRSSSFFKTPQEVSTIGQLLSSQMPNTYVPKQTTLTEQLSSNLWFTKPSPTIPTNTAVSTSRNPPAGLRKKYSSVNCEMLMKLREKDKKDEPIENHNTSHSFIVSNKPK